MKIKLNGHEVEVPLELTHLVEAPDSGLTPHTDDLSAKAPTEVYRQNAADGFRKMFPDDSTSTRLAKSDAHDDPALDAVHGKLMEKVFGHSDISILDDRDAKTTPASMDLEKRKADAFNGVKTETIGKQVWQFFYQAGKIVRSRVSDPDLPDGTMEFDANGDPSSAPVAKREDKPSNPTMPKVAEGFESLVKVGDDRDAGA